jgi:hypothetical protein
LRGGKEMRNRWEVLGTPRNSGGSEKERRGEQVGTGTDRNTNDKDGRREERMIEGGGNRKKWKVGGERWREEEEPKRKIPQSSRWAKEQ